MNALIIQIAVSAITFTVSVGMSMFIAGTRWGRVENRIENMSDRLARIEGMFTLTLKRKDRNDSL